MERKILSVLAFAMIVLFTVTIVSAAYDGSKTKMTSEKLEDVYIHKIVNAEDIYTAIKKNDFNAWKDGIVATLTEENFNRIVANNDLQADLKEIEVQIKEAWNSGNKDEVTRLKEEYVELEANAKGMTLEEYNKLLLAKEEAKTEKFESELEKKGMTIKEYKNSISD